MLAVIKCLLDSSVSSFYFGTNKREQKNSYIIYTALLKRLVLTLSQFPKQTPMLRWSVSETEVAITD